MWSTCARPDEPMACSGITLSCIWQVNAGADYQTAPHRYDEPGLIAIRTYDGSGAVEVRGHGHFFLTADTLFLTEWKRLGYYGTVGTHWRFDWFEFPREGGVGFPWHEIFSLAPTPWERETIAETYALLPLPDFASRVAASARFTALLYDWAARWRRTQETPDPDRHLVNRAIRRMQEDLSRPISLDDLAGELGIGTRRFRELFRRVMGMSPKHYTTEMRLQQAAHALRMGMGSVTHLAERLGYSSPYHFSSAFKARFGCSPSVYLQHLREQERPETSGNYPTI